MLVAVLDPLQGSGSTMGIFLAYFLVMESSANGVVKGELSTTTLSISQFQYNILDMSVAWCSSFA